MKDFSINISSDSGNLMTDSFMEDIKHILTEKHESDNREETIFLALL